MGSLLLIREQDSCVTEDWDLRALSRPGQGNMYNRSNMLEALIE
jgi:hypothetical protein